MTAEDTPRTKSGMKGIKAWEEYCKFIQRFEWWDEREGRIAKDAFLSGFAAAQKEIHDEGDRVDALWRGRIEFEAKQHHEKLTQLAWSDKFKTANTFKKYRLEHEYSRLKGARDALLKIINKEVKDLEEVKK